jgi:hypothetical protein
MPYIDHQRPTENVKRLLKAVQVYGALSLWVIFSLGVYSQPSHAQPATAETTAAEVTTPEAGSSADAAAEATQTTPQEPAVPEEPLYESRKLRNQSLLADALTEEARWLDTPEGKVLALYRRTEARTTHGVILLLHATEDPQSWPADLENLRRFLPRHGWETLALALPPQAPTSVPIRVIAAPPIEPVKPPSPTDAQDPSAETQATPAEAPPEEDPPATSPPAETPQEPTPSVEQTAAITPALTPAERSELVISYTQAAFEFLKTQGQFNLVLLVDNSAALDSLSSILPQIKANPKDKKTVDGPIQALILFNLQTQEQLTSTQLTQILASPALPVLDIFLAPNNEAQQKQRQLHLSIAMRNKLETYIPQLLEPLPQSSADDANSFLLRRIAGFMRQQAQGVEIKGR